MSFTPAKWLGRLRPYWITFRILWRDCGERKDRVLLLRARLGDLGAYDRLVCAYQGSLVALAYFMLGGDRFLAEKLTRDFFIQIYRNLRVLGYSGTFSHWLYRNFLLRCEEEWQRKRRSKPQLTLEGAENLPPRFAALLVHLSLEYREVVVSHEILELTYEEVSRILSLSVGTVKSRAHRARMKLKGLMKEYSPEMRLT